MVHQIIKSRFRIFIETAILTLLILLLGFSIGFFVETYRADILLEDYKGFEVEALDLKLQNYYYQVMDQASCEIAIQENFKFADRIYEQGLLIQRFEEESEVTEKILLEKKKYVLLKTELWLNSIVLKEKCENPFHTLVYFYIQSPDLIEEAEQTAISDTLREIKDEKGKEVILIPLAGDLNLPSVNMLRRIYNVDSLPAIVIDEKEVLRGFSSKEDILVFLD
jgi:hypothetical protein